MASFLPSSTRSSPTPASRPSCAAFGSRELNAIMERWVQSCRHELLDRTLIWNERHLRHALHQYEQFYNTHRAHRSMRQAAPLRAVPAPITDMGRIANLDVRRRDDSAVSSTSTTMPLELHGSGIRQAQSPVPHRRRDRRHLRRSPNDRPRRLTALEHAAARTLNRSGPLRAGNTTSEYAAHMASRGGPSVARGGQTGWVGSRRERTPQDDARRRKDRCGPMILCSHFAPTVRSNNKGARYRSRGNRALTCGNIGGRYWDRTSDLSGVNGALSR